MHILLVTLLFFIFCLIPSDIFAQESNSQARTQEIIASFSKTKHEAREIFGIRKERYKEMRSEPVVKKDINGYSGLYEVPGLGFILQIKVAGNGKIEATGYESKNNDAANVRKFVLKDTKLEGALLTAIKLYDDNLTEKFEGVFINLIDIEGISPTQIERRNITFGLGVTGVQTEKGSLKFDKLFYQSKR
jgi:hypothetical protein